MSKIDKSSRSRWKDITGLRSGRIVALHPVGYGKGRAVRWRCFCDCGKKTTVTGCEISSGKTRSCGCKSRPDLTGQRFSRLVVVRKTNAKYFRSTVWECLCDCGNKTTATRNNLKTRTKRSCGCLHTAQVMTIWQTLPAEKVPLELIKLVLVKRKIDKQLSRAHRCKKMRKEQKDGSDKRR